MFWLQELYLSNNQLTTLEGIEGLANLQKLDSSENKLPHLKG